ncbi:MAG TPA: hypothetical protein VGC65_03180 [Bacteroidia bacterium]|jgi:hypothetical protein
MKDKFDDCFEEAKVMLASGQDNKYIEFQLAEKGVPDEMINEVILEIKKLRKGVRKSVGSKQVIYGLSFLGVAFLFTLISTDSASPVIYVLWGLAITGLLIFMKGIANIIDL